MGLLQNAIKTYDSMANFVGVEVEGKETLAPLGHLVTRASILITLSAQGDFISAEKFDQKIIIPVTENSAGRTSAPAPHPLCDQVGYIADHGSEKNNQYLQQLKKWVESEYNSPKVEAIYQYCTEGTVKTDLEKAGLLGCSDGKITNQKDMICWSVLGLGDSSGPVWRDKDLFRCYQDFYLNVLDDTALCVCALEGEQKPSARQHLKGVVANHGNAKIISSNDSSNYTYRGRFVTPEESVSIGYEASQKAHNALKWVVANQGYRVGTRQFICWSPRGHDIPQVKDPLLPQIATKSLPSEYYEDLRKLIQGYRNNFEEGDNVVIAGFDAATSGRLAVTYYNDLMGSDFLNRLADWDHTCCWYDNRWGTSSPSLMNILTFAYGTERGDGEAARFEVDEKVRGQYLQRLINCRLERSPIPRDFADGIAHKAGNLKNVKSNRNKERLLFTACAVVKKYRYDHYKEEYDMAIEPNRENRSYQFGRLLAVMEKIERDTFDVEVKREPNAIRLQSLFIQRPGYASKVIMDQLKNAYYPRLNPGSRVYYDSLIGQIMEMLSHFGESEYNRSLDESYLLGYYLQRNELYRKPSERV